MNKKQLRKELEVTLVKTIEDLLISKNPEATKQVSDIIYGASKILAKKFYKTIKQNEEKATTAAKKRAVKKAAKPTPKKTAKPTATKSKAKK